MSDQVPKIFTLDGGLALKTSGTGPTLDLLGKYTGYGESDPDAPMAAIEDRPQQDASYGGDIPFLFGRYVLSGNMIWMRENQIQRIVVKKKASNTGGKGGGAKKAKKVKEIQCFATVAMALGVHGFVDSSLNLFRVWLNNRLIFGSDQQITIGTVYGLGCGGVITFYDGTQGSADPVMQYYLGAANCPDYKHLVYVVIRDLPLKNYGNTLQGSTFKFDVGNIPGGG